MKLYTHFEEIIAQKIQAEVKQRLMTPHDASFTSLLKYSHTSSIYVEEVNSEFDSLSLVVKRGGPLLLGAVSKF